MRISSNFEPPPITSSPLTSRLKNARRLFLRVVVAEISDDRVVEQDQEGIRDLPTTRQEEAHRKREEGGRVREKEEYISDHRRSGNPVRVSSTDKLTD